MYIFNRSTILIWSEIWLCDFCFNINIVIIGFNAVFQTCWVHLMPFYCPAFSLVVDIPMSTFNTCISANKVLCQIFFGLLAGASGKHYSTISLSYCFNLFQSVTPPSLSLVFSHLLYLSISLAPPPLFPSPSRPLPSLSLVYTFNHPLFIHTLCTLVHTDTERCRQIIKTT